MSETRTFTCTPLSDTVGAEIDGLDLRRPFTASVEAALRSAFRTFHLLLIRGQDVDADDHLRFAAVFGTVQARERSPTRVDQDGIQFVSNSMRNGLIGDGELDFHMDQLYYDAPLSALSLYGIEIPDEGGDTIFSNSVSACSSLPRDIHEAASRLTCIHTYNYDTATAGRWKLVVGDSAAPTATHPMLWTEPGTGRRAVWVNKQTTVGVVGMPDGESRALFQEVRRPLYDSALQYRHKWKRGDLIIWNNRTLQHARTPFDPASPRTLRRAALL